MFRIVVEFVMTVEDLTREAGNLSVKERGELITRLLDGLGRSTYDVSDEEVAQRVAETADGSVEDISQAELVSRLKYVKPT